MLKLLSALDQSSHATSFLFLPWLDEPGAGSQSHHNAVGVNSHSIFLPAGNPERAGSVNRDIHDAGKIVIGNVT